MRTCAVDWPAMDFSLTDDQREIQALAREFAQAEIEPNAAAWDREHHFPRELVREARRARPDGRLRAGGVRRRRRRLPLVHPRARGALARRRRRRRDRRGAHERVHAADPRVRHRRAAEPLRAAARARREDRRVRAHRGRGRARTPARCGRRRCRTDDGWRITGTKQWISNGEHAGTFLLLRPHRSGDGGRARRLRVRPRPRARRGDARRGEARAQLVARPNDCASRTPRRRRPPAARGAQGLHGRDGDARRRPDRDRRAGARDRAGRVRRRARVREGAARLRQADRRATRRSSGSSRTCRPRSTPPGCSSTGPRG